MPFIATAYLNHVSEEKRRQFAHTHVGLGYHPETHDRLLLPDAERYAGMYVLGVQGVGKSAFLEHLIASDASVGNAVIVIDAHGDLATHCLQQLPATHLERTYLLDLEDEAYPFGVNMFRVGTLDTSVTTAHAVDRLMHIFEVLWADVLSQQYLPRYVRAATLTLLANPGATLLTMYEFLLDAGVRQRMLLRVSDQTVVQFWRSQYEELSEAERMRRVMPLLGRLESLFMGRALVRNIVSQTESTVDFRRAITERELLVITLPVKTLPQDARLIGTILLSQIQSAVFSFADLPEHERPSVSLYIDEFQNYATPDIASLFTEGRKYKVKLCVAHQYRGQLPGYLQEATMTARTKVVFKTTPEDARALSHVFPDQETTIEPAEHTCDELLTRTADYPAAVQQFVDLWLRPLQQHRRGKSVVIKDVGNHPSLVAVNVVGILGGYDQHPEVRVTDPTEYLDSIFYEVMRSGNPDILLPREAVLGFSDLYRPSFYQYALRAGADQLGPHLTIPLQLLGRNPETAAEYLMHCVCSIREVMRYLAENPIGKQTAASPTDVGRMLVQLPPRAAFVRAGEDVGVIYTFDTPARVTGQAWDERLQAIRTQTRAKYCRSREEVEQPSNHQDEQATALADTGNSTPISRWEKA